MPRKLAKPSPAATLPALPRVQNGLGFSEKIIAGRKPYPSTAKICEGYRSTPDSGEKFGEVEMFDARGVSFVAVTQQFNTTTSMGPLTLNVLLSFGCPQR
ncbi:MAG: hypothetical protein WCB11_26980 [Terriglobales bacterium]